MSVLLKVALHDGNLNKNEVFFSLYKQTFKHCILVVYRKVSGVEQQFEFRGLQTLVETSNFEDQAVPGLAILLTTLAAKFAKVVCVTHDTDFVPDQVVAATRVADQIPVDRVWVCWKKKFK